MDSSVYFSSLIAAAVYLAVGIRLFTLSRRTQGRPEYLLALAYICTGVSYSLYELPLLFGMNQSWIQILPRIVYSIGVIPLLLFTRDVFRSDSRWANALVWAIALSLFAGVFFSMLNGDIEGLRVGSVWFWCDWVGYTAPYIWITAEALIAYRSARKRLRMGFCEPDVVNRFMLWALFGFLGSLASILIVPLYLEFAATQVWPSWGDYFAGGFEAAATAVLWFVFFPPAFYQRWVNRGAAAPADPAH
ncbi:MAG: hypothetical protein JRF15_04110 [Deltaproteobacteria bacterium]|nr:hypothetical protein [Deltaproteobacteria bacterium]